jgi:RNA polymerase sigma factor (sigma-70 family)
MPAGQFARVVQFCRRALAPQGDDESADAHLLDLFVRQRDGAAFEALVRRHGPMVLGVCRRVLGNSHDAEDAFQAVFLVLTRKAASIRPRRMVGNWLYGVAFRTSLEARRAGARRQVKERQYGEVRQGDGGDRMDEELLAVLDQELSRLPDRYRAVLVLCDLESATRAEAARQLGCKEGTVASRLDRARKMLAKRLTRRGLVLSGAALVAALSAQAAPAAVPPALIAGAVKTPARGGGGKVVALAERVLRAMWLKRMKRLLAVALLALLAALAVLAVVFHAGAAPPPPPGDQPPPALAAGDAAPEDDANLTARGLLHEEIFLLPVSGVAFSPDGKRLAAAMGRRAGDAKDGAVAILDLASWKELARLADGSGGAVTAVAFSPDGKRLATGSTRPRLRPLIHLWATRDNREELPPLQITGDGTVDEIVFSPEGSRLAVAQSGRRAAAVDVSAWKEEALAGPATVACRIDFSPNGKLLGLLGEPPILRLWDHAGGREVVAWKLGGKEAGLFRFAPRGGLLAATCDEDLHLIDRASGGAFRDVPLGDKPVALAFAPGGRNIAVALAGGDILLIDGRMGEIRQKFPRDPEHPATSSVAFSPDGTLLAVGGGKEDGGGSVRLWRGPRVTLPGWGQPFNPDGDCAIATEENGLVIRVPRTPHDLSAETGRVNAPRVLQEVEGDFSIQVKVCGTIRPTAPGSVAGHLAYQAGGLLLWGDNRNYVRLERAALNRDGVVRPAAAFEARVKGELAGARSRDLPDQDAWLRLERRGNQVFGSVSPDGREWTPLEPLEVEFPAKVRVGVTAVNAARQPLSVRFEDLRVGR